MVRNKNIFHRNDADGVRGKLTVSKTAHEDTGDIPADRAQLLGEDIAKADEIGISEP